VEDTSSADGRWTCRLGRSVIGSAGTRYSGAAGWLFSNGKPLQYTRIASASGPVSFPCPIGLKDRRGRAAFFLYWLGPALLGAGLFSRRSRALFGRTFRLFGLSSPALTINPLPVTGARPFSIKASARIDRKVVIGQKPCRPSFSASRTPRPPTTKSHQAPLDLLVQLIGVMNFDVPAAEFAGQADVLSALAAWPAKAGPRGPRTDRAAGASGTDHFLDLGRLQGIGNQGLASSLQRTMSIRSPESSSTIS